jgi:hypothetical protein
VSESKLGGRYLNDYFPSRPKALSLCITRLDKYMTMIDASNPDRGPGDTPLKAGATLGKIGGLASASVEKENQAKPERRAEAKEAWLR